MCHFAVKIDDKCAIFNILFIGYITFVVFVMSDFLAACVRDMRVRVYMGIWYTPTRYVTQI